MSSSAANPKDLRELIAKDGKDTDAHMLLVLRSRLEQVSHCFYVLNWKQADLIMLLKQSNDDLKVSLLLRESLCRSISYS